MPSDPLPGGSSLVPEVPTCVTSVRLDGTEAAPSDRPSVPRGSTLLEPS
jgi:hypothetical protein